MHKPLRNILTELFSTKVVGEHYDRVSTGFFFFFFSRDILGDLRVTSRYLIRQSITDRLNRRIDPI